MEKTKINFQSFKFLNLHRHTSTAKYTSIIASICLAILILRGCTSDHKQGQSPIIELHVLMEPDSTGVWRGLFDTFHQANPGIRVNHVEGPTATNTREDLYVTSFLSGQATYDLVYADVVWIPKFAAAGWLEDLTDRLVTINRDRFIPSSVEGGIYKDRLYRIPVQVDGGVLFYRRDLLESVQEKPPTTFSDLVRIAQKLQHPDELLGYVWQGKQYEGLVCNYLEVLVGHGGTWINPLTGEVGLDNDAASAALQFLVNCIHEWKISPMGVTTYAEEDSRRLFHSGCAVFHRNWPYVWPLSQQEDSPVKNKVGMIPMPRSSQGTSASTLGGWGFAIAKMSKHTNEAWKFIEFITAPEQIQKIHEGTGVLPAHKSFYENNPDPIWQDIYAVMKTTVPRPPISQYPQASDILQRYISAALTQRIDPKSALQSAASETRMLLNKSDAVATISAPFRQDRNEPGDRLLSTHNLFQ